MDEIKSKYTATIGLEIHAEMKTKTKNAEDSAVILIQGIVTQLTDMAAKLAAEGIDNAAVLAMRDSLAASTDALAAAVVANTPAAPVA